MVASFLSSARVPTVLGILPEFWRLGGDGRGIKGRRLDNRPSRSARRRLWDDSTPLPSSSNTESSRSCPRPCHPEQHHHVCDTVSPKDQIEVAPTLGRDQGLAPAPGRLKITSLSTAGSGRSSRSPAG